MTTGRLALRPGARVVRRDAGELQVGLDPPQRVVLDDGPDVSSLLVDLAQARSPRQPSTAAARALRALEQAGLLVDPDRLAVDRARLGPTATAMYARHGRRASAVVGARAVAAVGVVARRGLDVVPLIDLLALSGVPVVTDPAAVGDAAVCLVADDGPLPRATVDPLVAAGTPHLVLEGGLGGLRLGPFVVPGRTACLRCVDAHQADLDPRRPFLLEQLAADPDAAVPADPVSGALALAWAAHDLMSYVDGEQPATWSATVSLDTTLVTQAWSRHPYCGCAWDLLST